MTCAARSKSLFVLRASLMVIASIMFAVWSVFLKADAQSLSDHPVANPQSTVTEGYARFTLLTDRLIRIEWSLSGQFEDRASLAFINRRLPTPRHSTVRENGWLQIETKAVKLRYRRNAKVLSPETLSVSFAHNGSETVWTPGLVDNQNLLGTARTVDGFEGSTHYRDGNSLALENGLISRSGWALIDDSHSLLFAGPPADNHLSQRITGNSDWYLFAHGSDYKSALYDFSQVAGKIPMLPRFAFGYWWSRYWVYSDRELRDLVSEINAYDIPLDVLVIDMDWHETYGLSSVSPSPTPFNGMLGWTGYTWNKSLFPDPKAFLDWTKSAGLQVALNLHPSDGVAPMEAGYGEMLDTLGEQAKVSEDWIEYRMSNPTWSEAFFETMLRPHEDIGVDFWWLDWQQWTESKFIDGLNNTFWLNHVFFSDMQEQYPEKRPLLFHRWGGLGNHRYQIGFSGDAVISWKSLAFQPHFTATASNVGYGYWSHDIGGHIDANQSMAEDSELYLRWIQFGALSPILRTHSSKSAIAERRIWKHSEFFVEMRKAIRRRYRLFPYFYRSARIAHDTGVSIVRPMYYAYSANELAYQSTDQYMLGEDAIVAPISTPMDPSSRLAKQSIWLPPGMWYEWDTGTLIEGGRTIDRLFAADETPIYWRAGSIIPMLPEGTLRLSDQQHSYLLTITPGGDGQTEVYEDDGVSQDYLKGGFASTSISTERRGSELIVKIAPTEGAFTGSPTARNWTLVLENVFAPLKVHHNSITLDAERIEYDAQKFSATVELPRTTSDAPQHIRICFDQDIEQMANALSGKQGQFNRLRTLATRLKTLSAKGDWAATLPNRLLALVETPQRIAYQPRTALAELEQFETGVADIESLILLSRGISQDDARGLAAYLEFDFTKGTTE